MAKKFVCEKCPPGTPVKLQRVQYGTIEGGKFTVSEQTDLACCYCHTVYQEHQAVSPPEPPPDKELHFKKS